MEDTKRNYDIALDVIDEGYDATFIDYVPGCEGEGYELPEARCRDAIEAHVAALLARIAALEVELEKSYAPCRKCGGSPTWDGCSHDEIITWQLYCNNHECPERFIAEAELRDDVIKAWNKVNRTKGEG